MINFSLPDFYFQFDLNLATISLINDHPEYFYDDIRIGSVYGTFPGAIWNGGETVLGTATIDEIKKVIDAYNSIGIPLRFTFTNSLIEKKHLDDSYCNLIMELANNSMNEVLVNSKVLENYLKNKYYKYKFISSSSKCIRDPRNVNFLCKYNDMVLLDFRDNKDEEFIADLDQREKVEILVNVYCSPDCKRISNHYDYLSRCQLNFQEAKPYCNITKIPFFDVFLNPKTLTVEEVYQKYFNMGFNNFCIEGRTLHLVDIVESYVYYLAKPEYKDIVRYRLLKEIL